MLSDRRREVEALYKQARKLLLHEMTKDERLLVDELGWDDHATLPDAKLFRRTVPLHSATPNGMIPLH